MKKLMTMIAAVATAFGLYADAFNTGTSFEGPTVTDPVALSENLANITELSGTAGAAWWGETIPAEAMITAYNGGKYTGARPSQYGTEGAQDNYLALKTTGAEVLTRYAKAKDAGAVATVDVTAGNLFFDSLVKLTGFDEDPTIDADAKLAVWLSAIDADATASVAGETNLYVSVNNTKYNCGPRPALLDQWARVTIKAMPIGSGKIGFVVFVNQNAVKSTTAIDYTDYTLSDTANVYAKEDQLFPLANGTTVESVSFKGVGSVDDLVFTDQAPDFAKDTDFFTIGWDAGVASVTCSKLSFSTNGLTAEGTAKVVLPETATIEAGDITATFAADKMLDAITIAQDGKSASIASKTAGAVLTINDVATKYATAAEAIAELNDAEKYLEPIQATLKLAQPADAIVLDNVNITLTLDLAGQTITQGNTDVAAVMVSGPLTIQDSVGTGVLAGNGQTEGGYASCAIQAWGVDCAITGGQINGYVGADQLTISGENTEIEIATNPDMDQDETITVLPEDKVLVDNGEGYWIVGTPKVYVAQIGDNKYESLKGAVDAASDNDVIGIIKDYEEEGAPIVIDGKTLTISNDFAVTFNVKGNYPIQLTNATANVTFIGTGSFEKSAGSDSMVVVWTDGAKLTVEGSLAFTVGAASNILDAKGGEIVVNAGTFSNTATASNRCVRAEATGKVTINGGSYSVTNDGEDVNSLPVTTKTSGGIETGKVVIPGTSTATFNKDETRFCAAGYGTKEKTTGVWSVEELYTITFTVGDVVETNKIFKGDAVAHADPTAQTGYNFTGWQPAIVTPAAANADYVAEFAPIAYTITYTTGNGAVVTNGVTEYTIATETFNLPVAADIDMNGVLGVEFAGWTNATSEVVVTQVDKGTTGNLEFFAKWEAVAPAEKDPTEDDPTQIPDNETAATRYGDKVPATLANVSAKSICVWAKGNGQLAKDAEILEDAFLLNCENTEAAINAAKENFKATSITVNSDGSVTVGTPEGTFNGTIEQWGKIELEDAEWVKDLEGAKFFELKLVPTNLN